MLTLSKLVFSENFEMASLLRWSVSFALVATVCLITAGRGVDAAGKPIVIDTDVGSDFDDSAAIMLALQNNELDVKLIVTATDDTTARARIVAKYLMATGRTDVPIGLGIVANNTRHSLWDWAKDVDLTAYVKEHNGTVITDGVKAMADVIEKSSETVDIIAIAPATNFPSLLQRFPDVVKKARVRAMSGSLYRGYLNSSTPAREYNVFMCAPCSREMYQAGWQLTTTPLDTCGVTVLRDDSFDALLRGVGPYSTVLLESWVFWCSRSVGACRLVPLTSDVLYDTVAVLLATSKASDFLNIEERCVSVTDDGRTEVNGDHCTNIMAALTWKDGQKGLDAYLAWLANQISQTT